MSDKTIKSLTKEQEALLPTYRDKWLAIGRQTRSERKARGLVENLTPEFLRPMVDAVYSVGGLAAPETIVVCQGPLDMVNKIYDMSDKSVAKKDVFYSLQLSYGQHDAGWLSFYDYMKNVLGVKDLDPIVPLTELAKVTGWQVYFKQAAFIVEQPTALSINARGQLHCENGPAIAYADGFELYALNGVVVDKEMVMTPAEELNPKELAKITNVEIRREFVRKIGINRILEKLKAKVLDKSDDGMYELVALSLGGDDRRERPYLKMKNPSIDTYHVEGVPPGTKTVDEALAWRNGLPQGTKFIKPLKLT